MGRMMTSYSEASDGEETGPSLSVEARPRWSIWIDIEGFSKLWEDGGRALAGLRALMSGIYAIGNKVYTDDGDRLFAHQFGDGFVIVGDFHEEALDRCVAIAVVLMRHVTTSGCLARAAVAEGDFADYSGCWPKEIRQEIANLQSDDTVSLGSGIMTLLPVMGTALINPNKLDSGNCIKGAVLTIASKDAGRIATGFPRRVSADDSRLTMIDWVHATSPIIDKIVAQSGFGDMPAADIEAAITRYVGRTPTPPSAWIAGTSEYGSLSEPLAGGGGTV
jgi:hypothetical protein